MGGRASLGSGAQGGGCALRASWGAVAHAPVAKAHPSTSLNEGTDQCGRLNRIQLEESVGCNELAYILRCQRLAKMNRVVLEGLASYRNRWVGPWHRTYFCTYTSTSDHGTRAKIRSRRGTDAGCLTPLQQGTSAIRAGLQHPNHRPWYSTCRDRSI